MNTPNAEQLALDPTILADFVDYVEHGTMPPNQRAPNQSGMLTAILDELNRRERISTARDKEIAKLKARNESLCQSIADAEREYDILRTQLAEAQKDKALFDWAHEHCDSFERFDCWWVYTATSEYAGLTLREAIQEAFNAAARQSPKQEGT